MNDTLQTLAQSGYPPVVLGLDGGEISISRNQYMVTMEAGPSRGQTLPQFNALGAKDLVLVGSVLMEYCYVIHQYRVARDRTGRYTLSPFGMYAFNRPGGPKLITRPSKPRTPSGGLGPLDNRGLF